MISTTGILPCRCSSISSWRKIYSGTNLLLYYYGLQKKTLQGREEGYIGKGVLENGHPKRYAVPAQQYFQDISAGGTDHIAEEFVYDASFIKWRSASLTYTVPRLAASDGNSSRG
jgi:hypothetical protein